MDSESYSLSEQLITGEALLEKYFGQDKELFDRITMEEEQSCVLKENRGPLPREIQEKIENLNRYLLAVGYTPKQVIQQSSVQEAALESAIQLIYELIQREQKQKKQQEEWMLSLQQLETKYKHSQQWIEKLERKLEEKDRQHNASKVKDERQIRELEQQLQKWVDECTDWKIKTANWEQLQLQYGYELRKKDKEYQRLQQRLQQVMQEKSRKVGNHKNEKDETSQCWRKQPSGNEGYSGEELLEKETYHMMETCFQDRIQKLQRENECLRSFIYNWFHRMEQLLGNDSDNRFDSQYVEEEEHLETPLRWKLDLPFESVQEDIQRYFDEKLQQLLSVGSYQVTKEEEPTTPLDDNREDVLIHHSSDRLCLPASDDRKEQSTIQSLNSIQTENSDQEIEPREDSLSARRESDADDPNDSRETSNLSIPVIEKCILDESEENLDDYL